MKRILVVDDTLALLKQTEMQLASFYETMLAKSGDIALKIARQKRPDLFLLDMEMPGMDGFQLLTKIQEDPRLSTIPVIFYTTLADTATQVRAYQAGARDFIVKPTVKDVLIYRIGLHLQLTEYLGRMEQTVSSLSGIITESFVELINYRYKMGGHSERVPRFCSVLGRELLKQNSFAGELTPADLELIVQASPLHDIGNITIPDKILLKPGPLTEKERDMMKKHSSRGAKILEHFSLRIPTQRFLHYAKLIALTHHEAWDGGGYPSGLAGNAIPLCGRITAVADVYDDITSERVYRSKMDHDKACRAITQEKGKRFDPRIVDVFQAVAEELRAAG
ncbi:two-component system response regulator [Spirochaetia bacterium]|nr:two-component system response regulator [Spirochaetia bacterium]